MSTAVTMRDYKKQSTCNSKHISAIWLYLGAVRAHAACLHDASNTSSEGKFAIDPDSSQSIWIWTPANRICNNGIGVLNSEGLLRILIYLLLDKMKIIMCARAPRITIKTLMWFKKLMENNALRSLIYYFWDSGSKWNYYTNYRISIMSGGRSGPKSLSRSPKSITSITA